MENPYATESQSDLHGTKTGLFTKVLIALVPIGAIAANYGTASNVPRERWDLFAHVVFLFAPASLLIHLPGLIVGPREITTSKTRWWLLDCLFIPASFLLSISPYFSINPYEVFVVTNRFFGPYGWVLWAWLIVLGVLPFLELIPAIRRSRWMMMLLSLTVIGVHIHNAYWIWRICHMDA